MKRMCFLAETHPQKVSDKNQGGMCVEGLAVNCRGISSTWSACPFRPWRLRRWQNWCKSRRRRWDKMNMWFLMIRWWLVILYSTYMIWLLHLTWTAWCLSFFLCTWCCIGRLSPFGEQMMRSEDVWQPALLPGARIAGFETKETFGSVVGGLLFCRVKLKKLHLLMSINVETDCLGVSSLATDVFDEVLATENVWFDFHRSSTIFWIGYQLWITSINVTYRYDFDHLLMFNTIIYSSNISIYHPSSGFPQLQCWSLWPRILMS